MPDWTKPEIKQRLLTAIVASVDKLDVARIAQLYGEDVTKGAVEWQLRCIKKEAKLMKEGAGGSSAKNGDDDAALKKVKTGRVTKPKAARKKKSEETIDGKDDQEAEDAAVKTES